MKKDIEWLKTEINKMYQDVASGARGLNAEALLFKVYELAKELDEPETLSEEWINEHSKSYTMENSVEISDLKNLLLPQPKKPVIPKFVADYLEKWKSEGLTMSEWFTFDYDNEEDDEVSKWLYDNDYEENTTREHLFIYATRYGYEVEKEKRWVVKGSKGYLTAFDIGKEGNFIVGYTGINDTEFAITFSDKARAQGVATLLDLEIEGVTE